MSPDSYLHYAALFISYFVKVAVAYLLAWTLAQLVAAPRKKFTIWLAFMLGSLGYWIYALSSSMTSATVFAPAQPVRYAVPRFYRELFVPLKFEHPIVVLGRVLISAYVLGVVLLIMVGLWKRVRLHLLLRQGMEPSPELKHLFAEMCRHFGVRHCELLVLPKVSSPATVCWWRPRVVLPQACEDLNDSALISDVLYHELAHVARRDYLWSSLNDLICRLLFFHPGVWQARKQMSIHREMACDLAVIATRPEHRVDYAHTLTRVARLCLARKNPVVGIDFASVPSLLTHRVHAILNDLESISGAKKIFRALSALALVSGYALLCSVIALAIAFAPASQPVRSAEIQAAPKLQTHSQPRHKSSRTPMVPEEEGRITESPAYRFTTTSANSDSAGLSFDSAENSNINSSDPNGWALPGRGGKSAGRTVESIIVATVGTVIGADKDDRSKRKDSSHFELPPGGRNPH